MQLNSHEIRQASSLVVPGGENRRGCSEFAFCLKEKNLSSEQAFFPIRSGASFAIRKAAG
jgi:hypothetical protein